MDMIVAILVTTIGAATPLIFAAVGELVVEKAGVLNLGLEGMMLAGAVIAFAVMVGTGSWTLAILAAAIAGAAMALVFGVLTLTLMANQVATGLALTIFGVGLSALVGQDLVGVAIERLPRLHIPVVSDIPIIGPLLFSHDVLVYASIVAVAAVAWFLNHSRLGLVLRAVGESHDAAHALGYRVIAIRYAAVAFGGAMAGVGGAFLSLASSPMWAEQMTAGRGWIALALVVFSAWRPWRALIGAYLFGGVTMFDFLAQAEGWFDIPSQYLSMLPYLATILVLVLISMDSVRAKLNAPACLGRSFHPTT